MDSMDHKDKKPIKFVKRQDSEHPYCTNWPMSEEKQQKEEYGVHSLFPTPIYHTERNSILEPSEMKEIEDIMEEGMDENDTNNYITNSHYIFDGRLSNLKEFCERHIKIYVSEVMSAKQEPDFYITQSWLNMSKPGGLHTYHRHQNSLIGGVFYIETVEDDKIWFNDPNIIIKEHLQFELKEFNPWNSSSWSVPVTNNKLILFPSWLEHGVGPNNSQDKKRISLAFNVFARGIFGQDRNINKLIL